jgi:glycine dehydrogenase subunit 2
MKKKEQQTIFDIGRAGRSAPAQLPGEGSLSDIPSSFLRAKPPVLPEVSELQAVRHYTNLSRKNFSIETQFYPLGSCTMKYNPRGTHRAANLPGFLGRHPLRAAGNPEGRHRHEGRIAHADGRCSRRIRRRRDDPRVPRKP